MRTTSLFVYAVLAGCSSKPPPAVIPQSTTACHDLACLEANEGKVIDVDGTFAFPPDPKRKGQHLYRLVLADGTSVVLPHPKTDAMRVKLAREHDGKRITARGIYYKHPIPERYGIIQAVGDPYLVELYDVAVR